MDFHTCFYCQKTSGSFSEHETHEGICGYHHIKKNDDLLNDDTIPTSVMQNVMRYMYTQLNKPSKTNFKTVKDLLHKENISKPNYNLHKYIITHFQDYMKGTLQQIQANDFVSGVEYLLTKLFSIEKQDLPLVMESYGKVKRYFHFVLDEEKINVWQPITKPKLKTLFCDIEKKIQCHYANQNKDQSTTLDSTLFDKIFLIDKQLSSKRFEKYMDIIDRRCLVSSEDYQST
jgi:hypothetical protein